MTNLPNTVYIGQMAVFYVPTSKLDVVRDNKTARQTLHDFFVEHYNAYTHEISKIQGFWKKQNILVRDEHERYEVSFEGMDRVLEFVDFLSDICKFIEEDSIYLTMGNKSWLVLPKPDLDFENFEQAVS
jgi:hypothetical protein